MKRSVEIANRVLNKTAPVQKLYGFTAANGVPFIARRIDQGDTYGLNDCLTVEGESMIEFYDCRHGHDTYGQFVARYYVSTLARTQPDCGICLDGGVPEWTVDSHNFAAVRKALCA